MAGIERSLGFDNNVAEYATHFVRNFDDQFGVKSASEKISGRVLRGKEPKDFVTLTDNPNRRVAFLMDSSALDNLIGKDGRQILSEIGYPVEFTDDLLKSGTKFKLVVFPEQSVKLATWENLLHVVKMAYPAMEADIKKVEGDLPKMEFAEAMAAGGKITEVRTFLHKTVNVNELYTGNGHTTNGQKEFITENKPLTDLAPYILIGFWVK